MRLLRGRNGTFTIGHCQGSGLTVGLHSVPPSVVASTEPNPERCRRPGAERRNPRLFAAEVAGANVLDAWMKRRGVSNTELAEAWLVNESIVRDLRSRHRVLTIGHLLLVPRGPARRSLFAILEDAELELDTSAA